jgi:hypothetical protein
MFLQMRTRHLISALLAVALPAGVLPGVAAAKSNGPTQAQIHSALSRARRSSYLWATVNVCDTARHPREIGVRGQMPTLGFSTRLAMTVTLRYWSVKDRRFVPLSGFSRRIELGAGTTGTRQGGVLVPFPPHQLLSGAIRFEWRRAGKLLGYASRLAGHGYRHVDEGDPPGYSTATCRIK